MKALRPLTALATALVILVAAASAASATAVGRDGHFEIPQLSAIGKTTKLYHTGQRIGPWHVDAGDVSLDTTAAFPPDAPDGMTQNLDLNGSQPGSIYQDYPTVENQLYHLLFDFSGPLGDGVSTWAFEIDINGQKVLGGGGRTCVDHSNACWSRNLRDGFTAGPGHTTRIEFISETPGRKGPHIDNVRVYRVGS
jgi:hypothetical protein